MLPIEVVPVFVAVAILGYVAGHSSAGSGPSERQAAKGADVALGYPAGWSKLSTVPGIPGLPVSGASAIAPREAAADAGLVLGSLPGGEPAPLPASFVARLGGRLPAPQVVNLVETQAYKYSKLAVEGMRQRLTLFVIPNPDSQPMVFACYALPAKAAQLRACEQSVATATVVGEPQAEALTPEPHYADRISSTVATLDELRASLKAELHPDVTVATAQDLAGRLAGGFATAERELGRLRPPVAASGVHEALSDGVAQAHAGYLALASAIGARDAAGYVAAQKRVARAEAQVDATLRDFVLLGYSSTPQPRSSPPAGSA
ncbi:MAG TPA: hypothetical protein VL988_02555 [Solirubrobacteraceae bacterium]|nr:hypothetical protein [Solirubrobacteraceae bacterium]